MGTSSYRTFGRVWLRRLFLTPYVSFASYFFIVALLLLARHTLEGGLSLVVLGPWAVIALLFLNIPLLGNALERFQRTELTRCNHALEHGTIFFLNKQYGGECRVGGQASASGFRLSGVKTRHDVEDAFASLMDALRAGNRDCVVSPRCGSMIIVAEGFGVVLLTLSALLAIIADLETRSCCALLFANLVAFAVFRYPLGLWIQRRFFLSLDFYEAVLVAVKTAKDRKFYERPQTVCVSVNVRLNECASEEAAPDD